jgi:hypothetical protein
MKKILIVLTLILVVALPTVAFAAPNNPVVKTVRGICGIDTTNLTEAQKADLTEQFNKMIVLRKETINKMVTNGTISKEQGDLMLKNLDAMVAYRQQNGFVGGCGMGNGFGGGRGMMGNGFRGNFIQTTPTN